MPIRRQVYGLGVAAATVLFTWFTSTAPAWAEGRPNVIVIFVDDLGYADIGPFGASQQKTPELDRMAQEGIKLTSFYAAPVCSASRAQLMTGCYNARVSVPGVYTPASRKGLHPDEVTIAERLKQQGYSTMCIGKWHLGDQQEFLPTRQGFDHYFGLPYSNDMQPQSQATGEKVVPLIRDEQVVELVNEKAQDLLTQRYTEEAITFIRQNSDNPFFLYLPHTAVHTPIHPGAAFAGKSANGRFGDWVEEVDWSTGRILATLRELKLEKRTLVVFTSDNGPWLVKGRDGGNAGPLRGGKGSTWEGGVRVPALAWWPGRIPAGSVCNAICGTIDLLPTCVTLAGGTVPPEPVIDGRDISSLLFGTGTQAVRDTHYYFHGYELEAIRQGPWKLAVKPQHEWGKKGEVGKAGSLYNLEADVGERTDVAAQHPHIIKKLTSLAEKMEAEIGGKTPRARRPAGTVEAPKPLYPMIEQSGKTDPKNHPKNRRLP
jgi:arylsulfatase A